MTLFDRARCFLGFHGAVVGRLRGNYVFTACERCGRFMPIGRIVYSRGDHVWITRGAENVEVRRFDEAATAHLRTMRQFRLLVGRVGATPFIVDVRTPDDIYSGSET